MIMKTKHENKNGRVAGFVTVGLLIAGIMFTPKPAKADSIEFMAGNKNAVVDLKAGADITKKLGFFLRARPSQDFATGNISPFGLTDLTVNVTSGFDTVGELQFIGGSAVPRVGMQAYTGLGDFGLYNLTTVGMDSKSYVEFLTSLNYLPVISSGLKLLARVEDVSDVSRDGHLWSTQRLRLGLTIKEWGFGTATDLTETGNKPKLADGTFERNFGGFVSKTF